MLRSLFRNLLRPPATPAPAAASPTALSVTAATSTLLPKGATRSAARKDTVTATADATLNASNSAPPPEAKDQSAKIPPTDPAADYQRRLEERFGGQDASMLGPLVNGQPEGLAPNVKRNMFRVI